MKAAPMREMRASVRSGTGVIARFRETALFVPSATGEGVGQLLEAYRSVRARPGKLADALFDVRTPEPFCALSQDAEGLHVVLHGAITVVAQVDGERLVLGGHRSTARSEEVLAGAIEWLVIGEEGEEPTAGDLFDLVEGVVPGGGLELVFGGASSARPRPVTEPSPSATAHLSRDEVHEMLQAAPTPAADPESAAAPPAAAVDQQAISPPAPGDAPAAPAEPPPIIPAPPGEPPAAADDNRTYILHAPAGADPAAAPAGVLVTGVLCENSHFNNPLAAACPLCGGKLLDQPVTGTRPVIAQLVLEDGRTQLLAGNIVLGRYPQSDPAVEQGQATPLVVAIDDSAISRVHAEMRLEGWSILIRDRQSRNGTYICPPGLDEWIRLEADHFVEIAPGTGVMLGPFRISVQTVQPSGS
ncbi:MAG: FHA domain-containing protein [Chloroflexota bacterium]